MPSALILAGAVAKGAFEAGALSVLSRAELPFRRIVSSSAGSLNAVIYASGLRVGRATEAADSLVDLWTEHASWSDVFRPSVTALFNLRALSTTDKVHELLTQQLAQWLDGPSAPPLDQRTPVEMRLVVTLTDGTVEPLGPGTATTFEKVLHFDGDSLDDPDKRKTLVNTAIASAAFPLVFLPVDLGPGLGPAFDGGAVDNAPIHEAVHNSDIDRVLVVATDPADVPPLGNASGEAMIGRLADILIGERLFRDLADAYQTNDALRALDGLIAEGTLTLAQLARVRQVLGWTDLRPLEIVAIRPSEPLKGGAFSGFFSADTRRSYIELGRDAAKLALGR